MYRKKGVSQTISIAATIVLAVVSLAIIANVLTEKPKTLDETLIISQCENIAFGNGDKFKDCLIEELGTQRGNQLYSVFAPKYEEQVQLQDNPNVLKDWIVMDEGTFLEPEEPMSAQGDEGVSYYYQPGEKVITIRASVVLCDIAGVKAKTRCSGPVLPLNTICTIQSGEPILSQDWGKVPEMPSVNYYSVICQVRSSEESVSNPPSITASVIDSSLVRTIYVSGWIPETAVKTYVSSPGVSTDETIEIKKIKDNKQTRTISFTFDAKDSYAKITSIRMSFASLDTGNIQTELYVPISPPLQNGEKREVTQEYAIWDVGKVIIVPIAGTESLEPLEYVLTNQGWQRLSCNLSPGYNGLVGCYTFGEALNDYSSKDNDGELYGARTIFMPGGNSIVILNDAASHLKIPNLQNFYLNDATFSFWINPLDVSKSKGSSQLLSKVSSGGKDYIIAIEKSSTNPSNWIFSLSNSVTKIGSGPGECNIVFDGAPMQHDSQWHHITITRDKKGQFSIYIDGTLKQQRACSLSGFYSGPGDIYLGQVPDTSHTGKYYGFIDELEIISRAISSSEVTNIYNSQKDLVKNTQADEYLSLLVEANTKYIEEGNGVMAQGGSGDEEGSVSAQGDVPFFGYTGATIALGWDPSPDPTVIGYYVYAESPVINYPSGEITADKLVLKSPAITCPYPNSDCCTISYGLNEGPTKFWATAYNIFGIESPPSEPLSYDGSTAFNIGVDKDNHNNIILTFPTVHALYKDVLKGWFIEYNVGLTNKWKRAPLSILGSPKDQVRNPDYPLLIKRTYIFPVIPEFHGQNNQTNPVSFRLGRNIYIGGVGKLYF